jgi:hypothetical protein
MLSPVVFWLIVLGVIAVVLLLGYRHDRRRKDQVVGRVGVVRRYVTGAELYQELPPPQEPERYGGAPSEGP